MLRSFVLHLPRNQILITSSQGNGVRASSFDMTAFSFKCFFQINAELVKLFIAITSYFVGQHYTDQIQLALSQSDRARAENGILTARINYQLLVEFFL